MGKADELDGQRRGSVGFALTALQRRLASSPEAIWQGSRWWHQYPGRDVKREVNGSFIVSHVLGQGPKPA